jgi:hypothetical protein
LLAIFVILFLSGCSNSLTIRSEIPVIDVSKEYTKKTFAVQDIADIEYVPFETADKVLFDLTAKVIYLSENRIIVINQDQGDVFIFDRNGKISSCFNHKGRGPEEYIYFNAVVFDEENSEIFISTWNKILVFSEKGQYKRTLQSIAGTNFDLYNFDNETLLVYDKFGTEGGSNKEYRTKPYLFVSKKDGSTVSELDWIIPVRYSNMLMTTVKDDNGNDQIATMYIGLDNNWNDGENFAVADLSLDTIFQLFQDKKMTPLIIRKPSVHDNNPRVFLTPVIKTEKFIHLSKVAADFDMIKTEGFVPSIDLLYDFTNKQIYEVSFENLDCPELSVNFLDIDIAKNMAASLIEAHKIVDSFEKNKLNGILKQIAEKLDDEDNPVLMIMKFKESKFQ